MSDPYIPAEDRIDVIGRLTARLNDAGAETLREKAVASAKAISISDPPTPIKPVKDDGEKEIPKDVKDEGEKDGEKDLNRTFTREEHEPLRLEIIRQARTLDEVDDIVRVFALGPPRRR